MIRRPHTLEGRLARLERANRMLWLGMALAMATVLFGATKVAPVHVRVRGLELVDDEGRVRALLSVDDEGPGFHLMDESGVRRASLVHADDETGLFLQDGAGNIRVGAAHFAHGGSGYALHGPGGSGALVLYLKESGTLTYYGEDGTPLARFPAP